MTRDGEAFREKEADDAEARRLERLLDGAGCGLFQVLLMLVGGVAMACTTLELFSFSFAFPVLREDLHLSNSAKGFVDMVTLLGLVFGNFFFGIFGDLAGRKPSIFLALMSIAVSLVMNSFATNLAYFMVFSFIGGSGAAVSSLMNTYISEFMTEKKRGRMLTILDVFYDCGVLYVALLTFAVLEVGNGTVSFAIGGYNFKSWRIYFLLCSLPSLIAMLFIIFFSDTPAYLFHNGKHTELRKLLKTMKGINSISCCCSKQELESDEEGVAEELFPVKNDGCQVEKGTMKKPSLDSIHPRKKGFFRTTMGSLLLTSVLKVVASMKMMYRRRFIVTTILLHIIFFSFQYGYLGTQMWFPEVFQELHINNSVEIFPFPADSIATTNSFYQDTLFVTLASLLSNVVQIVIIDFFGAKALAVIAAVLSSVLLFSLWEVQHYLQTLVLAMMFNPLADVVNTCLYIYTTNFYPTEFRSTGLGVQQSVGWIGASVANIAMGYLLSVHQLPLLMGAGALLVTAVTFMFVPLELRPENEPTLYKLLRKMYRQVTKCMYGVYVHLPITCCRRTSSL